jgi:hypothetical protein
MEGTYNPGAVWESPYTWMPASSGYEGREEDCPLTPATPTVGAPCVVSFEDAVNSDTDIGFTQRHQLKKALNKRSFGKDAEKVKVSAGYIKLPLFAHATMIRELGGLTQGQPYATQPIQGVTPSLYSLYPGLNDPGPFDDDGTLATRHPNSYEVQGQLEDAGLSADTIDAIRTGDFAAVTFDNLLSLYQGGLSLQLSAMKVNLAVSLA